MNKISSSARTVLMVHAHSEADSFVTAMRDRLTSLLQSQGWEVLHSDLYEMGWNPVLSPEDFDARADPTHLVYALEQRHNYNKGTLSKDIKCEIEKVLAADLLIFTFPLFWFNLPAILKGWIDRVFISGLFYGGKKIYSRGGMRGKQATAAFSLGGREYLFGGTGIHGALTDGFLRSFFQGTLGYVGMEVIEPFVAYHTQYLPIEDRARALKNLTEKFEKLDEAPRIPMPDLSQFGDRFEPT